MGLSHWSMKPCWQLLGASCLLAHCWRAGLTQRLELRRASIVGLFPPSLSNYFQG